MLVRTPMFDNTGSARGSSNSLDLKPASTWLRVSLKSPATASSFWPAGVRVAPPPPEPPTARSTSVTPARLVRVSMACQAAL
jgi:hypothetical protein